MSWVMGLDDAKSGRMPTDAEHADMRKLLEEAMDAGAGGFSMHYAPGDENVQRDHDGTPMVTDVMNPETMEVFAQVLAERHAGTIEMTLGTPDPQTNFALTERMAEISGRPVIWNAIFVEAHEPAVHRMFLTWLRSCLERGLPIYGQGVTSHADHLHPRGLEPLGHGAGVASSAHRDARRAAGQRESAVRRPRRQPPDELRHRPHRRAGARRDVHPPSTSPSRARPSAR